MLGNKLKFTAKNTEQIVFHLGMDTYTLSIYPAANWKLSQTLWEAFQLDTDTDTELQFTIWKYWPSWIGYLEATQV